MIGASVRFVDLTPQARMAFERIEQHDISSGSLEEGPTNERPHEKMGSDNSHHRRHRFMAEAPDITIIDIQMPPTPMRQEASDQASFQFMYRNKHSSCLLLLLGINMHLLRPRPASIAKLLVQRR